MRLPKYVALTVGLTAAFSLAVPAAAQTHQVPEQGDAAANPVEDCLPAEGEEYSDDAVSQCILASLPDIVGTTHAASIVAVVANGIASGFSDGTFRPNADVSRAQMATFLSQALDLQPSEDAELPEDVDADSPHADAIAAIIQAGIAQGKADGSFAPHDTVSRGQMATMLTAALGLDTRAGGDVPEDAEGSVHADAIAAILENGVASGFADGSFRPHGDVSRGQMATFITLGLGL